MSQGARRSSFAPPLHFDSATAQLLTEAEIALGSLRSPSSDAISKKATFDACLNIEAIANTKMSGRQLTSRDFFRAPCLRAKSSAHQKAAGQCETLRVDAALRAAGEQAGSTLTIDDIIAVHRALVSDTTRSSYQGLLRTDVKPTGGGRYHDPLAEYAMVEPHDISRRLFELAALCNRDDLPVVAQAAMAHATFIAIHPFARANGKTARAIIQMVLARRGVRSDAVVPLTLSMTTSPHDYQNGIKAVLGSIENDHVGEDAAIAWVRTFAAICMEATRTTHDFLETTRDLEDGWLSCMNARADSASVVLTHALPGIPVFTTTGASEYIDRSFKRVSTAIDELIAEGVIVQITEGKRNRVFECPAMLDAYASIPGFQ